MTTDSGRSPSGRAATASQPSPSVSGIAGIANAERLFGTFNGFCAWAKCTPVERRQLAIHLAGYRAARTIEELAHEHLPASA